jgi:hypothetical protein
MPLHATPGSPTVTILFQLILNGFTEVHIDPLSCYSTRQAKRVTSAELSRVRQSVIPLNFAMAGQQATRFNPILNHLPTECDVNSTSRRKTCDGGTRGYFGHEPSPRVSSLRIGPLPSEYRSLCEVAHSSPGVLKNHYRVFPYRMDESSPERIRTCN